MSISEDHLHRYVLLALGVTAGLLLFVREPSPTRASADDTPDGAGPALDAQEVTRPALDTAIASLAGWIDRSARDPRTPLEANLRALALGRPALLPAAGAPPSLGWSILERLASSKTPVQPAAAREPTDRTTDRDGDALATLAILLETGVPLEQELPFASGPIAVRTLLERALPRIDSERKDPDPWALDLLSFAVLAGMSERRPELTRSTLAALARLDRGQRRMNDLQGDGAATAHAIDPLVEEFWRRRAAGEGGGRELQLSTAVFRAVAVLGDPELEQRALRHLNALLFRYQLEREVYRQLLGSARPAQRLAIHADALEALGRLEQALYGAQLTFRRSDRPGPAPRTATSMRRAASDLIDHLTALERSAAFDAKPGQLVELDREGLLRAAAHALRGLRAARVAT